MTLSVLHTFSIDSNATCNLAMFLIFELTPTEAKTSRSRQPLYTAFPSAPGPQITYICLRKSDITKYIPQTLHLLYVLLYADRLFYFPSMIVNIAR